MKTLRSLSVLLLALAFAPILTAQTLVTTNTTMSVGTSQALGANTNLDFVVDEGATLTVLGQPGWAGGGGRGSIFYASSGAGPWHLTIKQGDNGGGAIVLNGQADASHLSVTNQGGAILMHSAAAGGNYVTLIGGTTPAFTGTIQNFWAATNGGVIYMQSGVTGNTLTLNNFVVTGNGVSSAGTGSAYGGAISLGSQSIQNVIVDHVAFANNQVLAPSGSALGGVLYTQASASGTLAFSNVTFDSNSVKGATGNGGAIWAQTAQITLTNATFTNNFATTNGGAIFANGSPLTFTNATFLNNTADAGTGGAIQVAAASTLTFNALTADTLFQGNTANGNASAIYLAAAATLNLNAAAGHSINFYDPITAAVTAVGTVNINQAADNTGAILFDGYASNFGSITTVAKGTFTLANSATYGANSNNTSFDLASPATLTADTGADTIAAATINLHAGATIKLLNNATLTLTAATHNYETGLNLAGYGAFDPGAPIDTAKITVGDLYSLAPQILAITNNVSMNAGTLQYDIFSGNTSDQITLTGAASACTFSGNTTFDFHNLISGTYTLLTASSITGLPATPTTLQDGVAPSTRVHVAYDTTSGTSLQLTVAATNESSIWQGGADWNSAATNLATTDHRFVAGDILTFNATGGANQLIDITTGVTLGAMTVDTAGSYTFTGGAITTDAASSSLGAAADGALRKLGPGALNLDNLANEFTGGIILSDGAIAISKAAQLGAPLDKITFDTSSPDARILAKDNLAIGDSQTLAIAAGKAAGLSAAAGKTLTFDGAIASTPTSTLNINHAGETGIVLLTADHTAYQGQTDILAGNLNLADTATLPGPIAIATGGALGGAGTATGLVHAATGAIVQAGDLNAPVAQTLTLGSLNLDSGAILRFNILSGDADPANSVNSNLLATGAINIAGALTVDINALLTGNYKLVTAGGGFTGLTDLSSNKPDTTVNGVAGNPRITTLFDIVGNDLLMSIDVKNTTLNWTGATNDTWDTSGGNVNWVDKTNPAFPNRPDSFVSHDRVIFDDTFTGANRAISIGSGDTPADIYVADMTVSGSLDYTFTGGGIISKNDGDIVGLDTPATYTLTKTGAGTLTLANNPNYFEGGVKVLEGSLVTSVASIGNNHITIGNAGTVVFNETGDTPAVFSGTIDRVTTSGPAYVIFQKQGNGTLVFDGASVNVVNFDVLAGIVDIRDNTSITATGGLLVWQNATLKVANATLNARTFNHQGIVNMFDRAYTRLTINGNYVGNGGTFLIDTYLNDGKPALTDTIHITGTASGTSTVQIFNNGGPGGYTGTPFGPQDRIDIITIDGPSTATFKLAARTNIGSYEYKLDAATDDSSGATIWSLISPELAPEVQLSTILAPMSHSMAYLSLTNLQDRLGEFRADPARANGFWSRVAADTNSLKTTTLDNVKVNSALFQFGALHTFNEPFGHRDTALLAGFFADMTDSNSNLPADNANIHANQKGGGVFLTYKLRDWYADLLLKYSAIEFQLRPADSYLSASTKTLAYSLEIGRKIDLGKWGALEPQAQLTSLQIKNDDMKDMFARRYYMRDTNSLQGRLGLRWIGNLNLRRWGALVPWVRVSLINEFAADYKTDVLGVTFSDTYENDFGGAGVMTDAGINLELARDVNFYLSAAWASLPAAKTTRATAGLRIAF